MEDSSTKLSTHKWIITLVVLLIVTLTALVGTVLYQRFFHMQNSHTEIPYNVISPEKEAAVTNESLSCKITGTIINPLLVNQDKGKETSLKLYRNQNDAVTPFQVGNMFPGDSEDKSYTLEVSYKGSLDVNFRVDIYEGYEKLAEVLKCSVTVENETVYDGLMTDMPESIVYSLPNSSGSTATLTYNITAYLDTSVGNEYVGKELHADFIWWVNEDDSGELIPPETGDNSHLNIFVWISIISLFAIIILLLIRKNSKEEDYEQQ